MVYIGIERAYLVDAPMKKSSEEFVYKHITKLPRIGLAAWSALMSWVFGLLPLEDFIQHFIRNSIFGFSCIFLWFVLDDRVASRFRRRVLLRTPGLREAVIRQILEDKDVYDIEADYDGDEN